MNDFESKNRRYYRRFLIASSKIRSQFSFIKAVKRLCFRWLKESVTPDLLAGWKDL